MYPFLICSSSESGPLVTICMPIRPQGATYGNRFGEYVIA